MATCQNMFNYVTCYDNTNRSVYDNTRRTVVADWHIGANSCNYRPYGGVQGYVNTTLDRLKTTFNNIGSPAYMWIIDTTDYPINAWNIGNYKNYQSDFSVNNYGWNGRHGGSYRWLPFWGQGALYNKGSSVIHIDSGSMVQYQLSIGQELARHIKGYERNCYHNGCYNATGGRHDGLGANGTNMGQLCCFDSLNGAITQTQAGTTVRQSWALSSWREDIIPECIRYADHVTVHTQGQYCIGYEHSYFKSASILYSNVTWPSDVSEEDAENNRGNLVFDVNTRTCARDTWIFLCEVETWPDGNMISKGRNYGWWTGGSRSKLYYRLTDAGIVIGATGEYGGKTSDECNSGWGADCNNMLGFMAKENKYSFGRFPQTTSPTTEGICFDGHGIRIKARVVDQGQEKVYYYTAIPFPATLPK